ncbi:helix-turn-helix domain-containing protein [Ekhidna sp.]
MEILVYLFIIAIAFGFFMGSLILYKPFFKSATNNYLAYAILIISILMLNIVLMVEGVYYEYDLLTIFYDIEWVFLFPVFLFIFVLKRIDHKLDGRKELKLLYLPFILSVILNTVNALVRDFELFEIQNQVVLNMGSSLFSIESFSVYLFNLFMSGWLFFILKDYNGKKDLKWLWRLWCMVLILVIAWTTFDFLENTVSREYMKIFTPTLLIGISVFLFWVSYNTIYKHKLTTEIEEITELLNQPTSRQPLRKSSSENTHFSKFEKLFEEEHIYRDPGITRESIAERLEISPGYLSQLINSHADHNFATYINQHRIDEVKKMLHDSRFDRYSIESIGLEAGFSSKTTFYKTFKNLTSKTPKEYKNHRK